MNAIDLTKGKPIKQILLFSLPLVLGTLFQQLYSFMDTIMVGRFIGEDALAGVGATYSLHFLILGFVQGACVGLGIPLAQAIGSKDNNEFKKYFWNGTWICCLMAIVLTLITVLTSSLLLKIIKTPENIFSQANIYIKILFLGIPASILYNFCAGVLRAYGDSKRPFYFLLVSSFLNIFLDYIFIVPLSMGVAGAAIATVFSQLVSGLLNLYWIVRKTGLLTNSKNMLAFSFEHIKKLCIISFPMGFEYSISAIGAVIMQGAINSFGSVVIAGQTSGEKIRQMFTLPMESVGMGIATYAGQNLGAKRYDRIKEGLRAGITIQWTYCIFAWVVIFFGKNLFTYMVLGESTSDTALISVEYLSVISIFFFIHGALMIFRNTLQGMGYSLHAVLSGVGELIGRSIGGFIAVATANFLFISIANPMAWGLSLIYCVIMVTHFLKKLEH